ncbi:hypothetical protein QMG52_03350 [Paenarthrobacter sp. PH39-S1]|nr:hypothetical protein [Paenarthrobacter sp. PH39-S1]
MNLILIFVFPALGCVVLSFSGIRWMTAVREQGRSGRTSGVYADPSPGLGVATRDGIRNERGRPRSSRVRQLFGGRPHAADTAEMARLVRELSALLAAGRSGQNLWADMLATRVAAPVAAGRRATASGAQLLLASGGQGLNAQLLQAAYQATVLGLSASSAIRSGCAAVSVSASQYPQCKHWQELAACLDVAEISGSPLAAVLQRYAVRLESEMDAAASRETSLAGPKATVRLLSWLPLLGLLLGMLMGVDPLAVLFGGPVGWAALSIGVALMAAGRFWSGALIRAAARDSP